MDSFQLREGSTIRRLSRTIVFAHKDDRVDATFVRSMPRVIFERTRWEVELPNGGRIVDVCDDDVRAGVPLACRHANCGTCRLEVMEGAALCESPNPAEQALLERLGSRPRMRLGCQLVIREGEGVVRLRVTF